MVSASSWDKGLMMMMLIKDENNVAANISGVAAVAATINVFYRCSQPTGRHKPVAADMNRCIYVLAATPLHWKKKKKKLHLLARWNRGSRTPLEKK